MLGTQESAAEGGHILKAIGVTWSDRTEAAALRDALAARGISDVMLVSELHAAGALAQAAGRAVGYESTGLLFIDRDTATLSVVRSDDGSIVKVLSRSLHSADAMAVLADMVAAVEAQEARPQGMFVVGSGVDIASVKAHLADLVAMPVSAPEESGLALARGAALAAANAPAFDATTAGLAYSLDPDGTTAGNESVGLANADTQMAPVDVPAAVAWADDPDVGARPRLRRAAALRGGPQAVPARRQRADVDLRGRRCRPCHFACGEHPADGRPAAGPRPERDRPERRTAAPGAEPSSRRSPRSAPPPAETIKAPMPVVQEARLRPRRRGRCTWLRLRPHRLLLPRRRAPAPAAPAAGRSTARGGSPGDPAAAGDLPAALAAAAAGAAAVDGRRGSSGRRVRRAVTTTAAGPSRRSNRSGRSSRSNRSGAAGYPGRRGNGGHGRGGDGGQRWRRTVAAAAS